MSIHNQIIATGNFSIPPRRAGLHSEDIHNEPVEIMDFKMILNKMNSFFSRIISPFKLFGKIVLLLVLLALSWGFFNIANLIKSKQSTSGEKSLRERLLSGLYRGNEAQADVPSSSSGKGWSTPFLAYFDGKSYKIENDIMFGRPKSYHPSYEVAKSLYEDGRITPDLYKIAAPVKPHGNKLLFQIQEIELEESYFKWIDLRRVIHPEGTEVIVDSEYKKFYILDKARFEQKAMLPIHIVGKDGTDYRNGIIDRKLLWQNAESSNNSIRFQKDDSIEITFRNLKIGEIPYLIVKSWFRDWVLGLEEDLTDQTEFIAMKRWLVPDGIIRTIVSITLIAGLITFLQQKGLWHGFLAFAPFIRGDASGTGPSGDPGDPGDPGSMCPGGSCSFIYHYQDVRNQYHRVGVSEPRAWHYNTEIIELPRESVLPDGILRLRISSSKRHVIGFIAVAQELERFQQKTYKEEKLELLKAYHNRLGEDVAAVLDQEQGSYVQTLPGDTIDLEFAVPKFRLRNGEKETYLIRASGFYTSLRKKNRIRIGDWHEKISDEAKTRLASLVGLKHYV